MLNCHEGSLTSCDWPDLKQPTRWLTEGNRTTDQSLISLSITERCVVVTNKISSSAN